MFLFNVEYLYLMEHCFRFWQKYTTTLYIMNNKWTTKRAFTHFGICCFSVCYFKNIARFSSLFMVLIPNRNFTRHMVGWCCNMSDVLLLTLYDHEVLFNKKTYFCGKKCLVSHVLSDISNFVWPCYDCLYLENVLLSQIWSTCVFASHLNLSHHQLSLLNQPSLKLQKSHL